MGPSIDDIARLTLELRAEMGASEALRTKCALLAASLKLQDEEVARLEGVVLGLRHELSDAVEEADGLREALSVLYETWNNANCNVDPGSANSVTLAMDLAQQTLKTAPKAEEKK